MGFIAVKLNQMDSPQFRIKDKRGVRERWVFFRRKFRSKIREEEAAIRVVVEDLIEKEVLIEPLIEREDTIKPGDNLSVQQKNDKDKAEDIREKAMENMWATKKRKLSRGTTDEDHTKLSKCHPNLHSYFQFSRLISDFFRDFFRILFSRLILAM